MSEVRRSLNPLKQHAQSEDPGSDERPQIKGTTLGTARFTHRGWGSEPSTPAPEQSSTTAARGGNEDPPNWQKQAVDSLGFSPHGSADRSAMPSRGPDHGSDEYRQPQLQVKELSAERERLLHDFSLMQNDGQTMRQQYTQVVTERDHMAARCPSPEANMTVAADSTEDNRRIVARLRDEAANAQQEHLETRKHLASIDSNHQQPMDIERARIVAEQTELSLSI